jgi:hypothetical protein
MTLFSIHKTKTSLALCGLSFMILITLGFYARSLSGQIEGAQHRLSSLKKVAAQSQESAAFLETHRQDFAAFEACGFEHPVTRETLQSVIHYPIEFGETSSLDEQTGLPQLVAQDIIFSVSCMQDRDVFKLLERLASQGPGIFLIQEVKVDRILPLSDEVLEKIAQGKSQPLFEGRISARWVHQ